MKVLPPPNWSPTGNSGTWYWDEQGQKNLKTGEVTACWRFHDDVLGLVTEEHLRKTPACGSPKKTKLKWYKKLLRLIIKN